MKKMGRPHALSPGMQAALKHFLEAEPWAYLEEMSEYLSDEFDIFVDLSTISRTLKRMKISRKLLKKRPWNDRKR